MIHLYVFQNRLFFRFDNEVVYEVTSDSGTIMWNWDFLNAEYLEPNKL